MAWTQSDIDRLKKAIASGVKQVMEGGRMVTYDSFESMKERLQMMQAEVNGGRTHGNFKASFRMPSRDRGDGGWR
jgi:hypothetical protein